MTAPGRLRLARLLCRRLQPFGAGKTRSLLYPYDCGKRDAYDFRTRAKTGSMFTGNTADFHAHPFAVSGYSDWRNWAMALALSRPGDLIVEVGANVGTETVGFSDIVGSGGRVVAFEPLPSNLALLERVTRELLHQNVTLLPYALSDRVGNDSFAVPSAAMSQGIGHLLGPGERATGSTTYWGEAVAMTVIEVESRMLDEFAHELEGVRLLVCDAEGSEVLILRGGRRVLEAHRPSLVLEASRTHQARAGFEMKELHHEISALGYRAYAIGDLNLEEVVDPASCPPHSNWVCLPRDRPQLVRRARRYLRLCGLMPCILGLNPLTRPGR